MWLLIVDMLLLIGETVFVDLRPRQDTWWPDCSDAYIHGITDAVDWGEKTWPMMRLSRKNRSAMILAYIYL